jgi:hypothetical protein
MVPEPSRGLREGLPARGSKLGAPETQERGYNPRHLPMKPIRLIETSPALASGPEEHDSAALRIDLSRRITLRFQLKVGSPGDAEAMRYARRAMIREERTRGVEWDEPSMEDPTLLADEIRWCVLTSQVAWCRQKVTELVERANRAREAMRALGH